MGKSSIDEFSKVLLDVYRTSAEQPLESFQDAVLETIKPVLAFDSSMWGTAAWKSAADTPGGFDVHTIHLHERPPDMLPAYEEIKHLDTTSPLLAQNPVCTVAFDVSAWFAGRSLSAVRDFGDRFEHKHFFISSRMDLKTQFMQWITLFRSDGSQYCLEPERVLLAGLAPHLMQALGQNRSRHIEDLARGPGGLTRAAAVADLRGVIYHATPHFQTLLVREWSGGSSGLLPEPLLRGLQRAGHGGFLGRTLAAQHHIERDLLFVRLRERSPVDALTPREKQAAELLVQGFSHKEAAQRLGSAPATVRNQTRAIYAKLGVDSVAGLAQAWRVLQAY